ncbi:hypothetical protein DRH14_03825, partial [Candidatus Shapirobacteria bacterium]
MAIKGLSLDETVDYISQFDKDDPKVTWILGVLSSRVRKHIGDIATSFNPGSPNSSSFNIGRAEIEAVSFGLKGFKNFVDSKEKPIKFETEKK